MLRGKDVSRIEGFSDAVFGFALTLLVVSLEVPEDYADLQRILIGFPAFAVTFAIVCWVWYEHYLLFSGTISRTASRPFSTVSCSSSSSSMPIR